MSGLDRLAKLYARVERARLVEVRAATALCDEVKVAQQGAVDGARTQNDAMRAAFAAGDGVGWKVSEVVGRASLVQAERLLGLAGEREVALDVAEALYRESRVQAEQMQKMVERGRARAALEEARKAQAAADDRYGSRLKWTRGRAGDEGPLM